MSKVKVKEVILGDNADLSKNFVLSVPAVADGTLTIKRQDGTNVLSIGANGKAVIPGVVGTVAQVGGIPTGQVVERGSNANGEYVRFADGTQICTFRGFSGVNSGTWTYPAAFISDASISMFVEASTVGANVFSCLGMPSLSSATFRKKFMPQTGGSWGDANSEALSIYVSGRWF